MIETDMLTLQPGDWYGYTMYPGYLESPYHSPIVVEAVVPIGSRLLQLSFINFGYAQGVQDFKKRYRVHRRGTHHLILDEIGIPERTIIIVPLTPSWISACRIDRDWLHTLGYEVEQS